jgi:NDP-sugar pyrophosphorylase family protein
MKAMIFAAGKGTRLKSLTEYTPKALIKMNGVPMLEIVILKLKAIGVNEIVINVHYLAEQIIDFLKKKNNFDIHIEISDEQKQLLDTGGGLKKASWFFNDKKPFIVHNVDIISNIDLLKMYENHLKNEAMVSVAIRKRISSRYFLFNQQNELSGWKNIKTSESIITKSDKNLNERAFSGIHIINPEIFNLIKDSTNFSIVNTYLELSKTRKIIGFDHTNDYWFDIGTIDKLKETEDFFLK